MYFKFSLFIWFQDTAHWQLWSFWSKVNTDFVSPASCIFRVHFANCFMYINLMICFCRVFGDERGSWSHFKAQILFLSSRRFAQIQVTQFLFSRWKKNRKLLFLTLPLQAPLENPYSNRIISATEAAYVTKGTCIKAVQHRWVLSKYSSHVQVHVYSQGLVALHSRMYILTMESPQQDEHKIKVVLPDNIWG